MSVVARHKLATVVLAGLALVPAGAAVAYAQSSPGDGGTTTSAAPTPTTPAPPAATPAAAPSRKAAKAAIAQVLRHRTVHGDLIVKDKDGQYVTVTFDRGTVQAASTTSLTVQRADGQTVQLALDAGTAYHGIDSASGLQTGKAVVVLSRNGTATHVAQRAK